MTRTIARVAVVGAALLGAGVTETSAAVPKRVASVAERSVFAANTGDGTATAFAFGDVVVAAGGGDELRLVAANGDITSATLRRAEDSLATYEPSAPVRAIARQRGRVRDRVAYVIGPPVGYAAGKVRRVEVPRGLSRGRTVTLPARLPHAFRGAPVVDGSGRFLGVVSRVRGDSATVAPARVVAALAAAEASTSDGSLVPVLLAAALALLALATGAAVVARRRRGRVVAPAVVAEPAPSGPLVRRRDPTSDDFEVVLRSREGADDDAA
jgi:hypothetical protein